MQPQSGLACRLSTPELAQRLDSLRTGLFAKARSGRQPQPAGLDLTFATTDDNVDDLLTFIRLERQCCPFLTFTLTIPSDHSETTLTIASTEDGGSLFIAQTFLPLLPEGLLAP